eukprot:767286-Hanusia_phi.AAC.5
MPGLRWRMRPSATMTAAPPVPLSSSPLSLSRMSYLATADVHHVPAHWYHVSDALQLFGHKQKTLPA